MEFERRSAISNMVLGAVVVVILVIAGIGLFIGLGSAPGTTTVGSSTSLGSTSLITTSASSSSTATSSSSSSSSSTIAGGSSAASSASSSTQSSSSAGQAFAFTITATPDNILMAPGGSQSYMSLVVAPCSPLLNQTPCNLPSSGSESVSLNASAPDGIAVRLSRSSVNVGTSGRSSVELTVTVGSSVAPGDYSVSVQGKSGELTTNSKFTVHVVQYLVYMISNNFSPDSLKVKSGSTVYWINLDAPAGGDPEVHNVIFTSGTNAQSSTLQQYATYSFTFTAAGNYTYYCSFHPGGMKGIVMVTP